jgi:glucose/arabinose dehydrogenase
MRDITFKHLQALVLAAVFLSPSVLLAQTVFEIEPIVTGLNEPWAVAPLPDGAVLITQRNGELILQHQAGRIAVQGVPKVAAVGQGGLLDVTIARDFAQTGELFLTYSKPQKLGSGTALARARLSDDGQQLEDVTELFAMTRGSRGGRHFGSRVVEAADGTLFLTIGDRGDRPSAQDRSRHNGSVIRIHREGGVPKDNPFVDVVGIQPEIYSYGHRNPQGAALDLEGELWVSEHGARGGDEINAIRKGENYGWPVISYGRHYSGDKIGEGNSKDGMAQPAYYWDPSIAPSGLMVYSGALFPEWKGDMFVGSLKNDYIARLSGNPLEEVAQIENDETIRVRDIVEGPNGAIWFISVGQGSVYRIRPTQ